VGHKNTDNVWKWTPENGWSDIPLIVKNGEQATAVGGKNITWRYRQDSEKRLEIDATIQISSSTVW
jgi:hypothetical protein